MKVDATKQERFVHADRNKLCTGKNGGNMPSSLGSRLNVVIRQTDKILAVYIFNYL